MEERLGKVAYWIGIICTVVAVVGRGLAMIGVWVVPVGGGPSPGRVPLSYKSFLDGAVMFYVMAIASSAATWVKAHKS